MKTCVTCGRPVKTKFSKCSKCRKAQRKWLKRNRVKYYSNHRELVLHSRSQARSRLLKCDFSLTIEWVKDNIVGKPCVYCGTTSKPIAIDRADNSKGYTPENCVPCCQRCNSVKGHRRTFEEMLIIGLKLNA